VIGMRSEKEIREKDLSRFCIDLLSEDQDRIKEWILEGEPRYSVKELEKILKYCWKQYSNDNEKFFRKLNEYAGAAWMFESPDDVLIALLKKPKMVKKILEGEGGFEE